MYISENYVKEQIELLEEQELLIEAKSLGDLFRERKGSILTTVIVRFFLVLAISLGFTWLKTKNGKEDKKRTEKLRALVGNKKTKVYKLPDKQVNAFTTITGTIFYTAGIEQLLTERELMAVLLHEYGHKKKLHVIKTMTGDAISSGFTALVLIAISETIGVPLKIIKWLNIFAPNYASMILDRTIGRKFEYDADSYVKPFGYANDLKSGLEKAEYHYRRKICAGKGGPKSKECDWIMKKEHSWSEHPETKDRISKLLDNRSFLQKIKDGNINFIRKLAKLFKLDNLFD